MERARELATESPYAERNAAYGLLLLLLTPALIWGCWSSVFLRYDDPMIFLWGGTASVADAFKYHAEHQVYYPLTLLSWYLDKLVWSPLLTNGLGEAAWAAGIRISNVLLHALAGVFVFQTLRQLRAPALLATFAMTGFALHPSTCESVCWAVERKNVLAGCFGFAALFLYVKSALKTGRGSLLALGLFTAALLSKPSALGFFPVVLAWEALGQPVFNTEFSPAIPPSEDERRWKPALMRLLPWGVCALVLAGLNYVLHENLILPPPGGSVWTALLTDAEILSRYLLQFLWPLKLSFFYGVTPIVSVFEARFWIHFLALAAGVAATLWLCEPRQRRLAVFGWLWFLGAMVTSLNLLSISFLMQDRYVYLSAPGFWLAVGLAFHGLFVRMQMSRALFRRLGTAAVIVAALAWALLGATRSRAFADSTTLFEDAVAKQPQSSYAQLFLAQDRQLEAARLREMGMQVLADEQADMAIEHYEAGFAAPDFERFLHQPGARMDLALLYYARERYAEAAAQAEASLHLPPWIPLAQEHVVRAERLLGMCAYKTHEYERAMEHFAKALAASDGRERDSLAVLNGQTALDFLKVSEISIPAERSAAVRASAAAELRKIQPDSPSFESAKKLLALLSPQK